MKFRYFPNIFYFPKILSLNSFGNSWGNLCIPCLISNNRASFLFWWKENLVKHRKFWKYYENDCRLFKNRNFLSILWLGDQILNVWMNWEKLCPTLSLALVLTIFVYFRYLFPKWSFSLYCLSIIKLLSRCNIFN